MNKHKTGWSKFTKFPDQVIKIQRTRRRRDMGIIKELVMWSADLIEYVERYPQIINADMADSIMMLKKSIAKARRDGLSGLYQEKAKP